MSNELLRPLASWDSEATWRTFEDGTFHDYIGKVELQKSEHDLTRYRDLIEVSQPDLIIETGTRAGGSALWFQDQGLSVITIDLSPQWATRGRPPVINPHGPEIVWMVANSIRPETLDDVRGLIRGRRTMVSLDADHHSPHVQVEIALWSELVSPGCYLVVEDGCFDLWEPRRALVGGGKIPEVGGTLDALNKQQHVLKQRGFWRDEALEGLTAVSHSPVGWWRRGD